MHTECIKRIIIFQFCLYYCYHKETYDASSQSYHTCSKDTHRSGCRCDDNQTCYSPRAYSYSCRFAIDNPVNGHPSKRSHTSCYMCNQKSICIQSVSSQTTTSIETEPSKPQTGCANKHKWHTMSWNRFTRMIIPTFAQHQGHNKSRNTSIDMDNRSTCEINNAQLLHPTAAPHKMSHWIIRKYRPQNRKEQKT